MTGNMDHDISSFLRLGNHDIPPTTPRLFLEVKAPSQMSLTLPYKVQFVLRRAKRDGVNRPCVVRWNPSLEAFGPSGLIVLRHASEKDDSFEQLAIEHDGLTEPPEAEGRTLTDGQTDFWFTLAPGGEARLDALLPERYYRVLQADGRYTLLYPGAQLAVWDWGSGQNGSGTETRQAAAEDQGGGQKTRPALVVPGGARVSFATQAEQPPWPGREALEAKEGFHRANLEEWRWRREEARQDMRFREDTPPPRRPSERVPESPALSVTLQCAPTMTRTQQVTVTVTVTYDGVCGPGGDVEQATRPITFRSWAVMALEDDPWRDGFRLYRRRGSDVDGPWEECEEDDGGHDGFRTYDGPDRPVHVASHEQFTSLRPGESWTTTTHLQSMIPADAAPGDVFSYGFRGAVVDWWDWGSAEDHAETVVVLPSWIADRVVRPADNEGRPRLVVPKAGPVDLRIVG
ncbi:Kinesin light [Colletotrichum higginsianum IMI 349063]|uniref:Kinesin light n=2 Tax=Colletotrichum higginsianum (strain IMI 349063) TaxID=759273 RepID=A0A1B7YEB9_COLHI|nr:Kinesin light [Colletotrichum higginsianum IMI 349063]OBR10413.1 Kinesin light [Colletotrichum higginsianum IMI 349063]